MDKAAVDKAHALAVANDRETPWSPAWIADRMARTDARFVRVTNDPDCCAGLRCMHYASGAAKKVTGPGANAPTGKTVSLIDGLMRLRGQA